jgi:hypothetical protein
MRNSTIISINRRRGNKITTEIYYAFSICDVVQGRVGRFADELTKPAANGMPAVFAVKKVKKVQDAKKVIRRRNA